MTTFEYDDETGRLVRAVTEREPEWGDDDRGWAFALLEHEADRCQGCGKPLSESTLPEAEGAYRADLPTRCHACTPMLRQQEEYKDSPGGLLFTVSQTRPVGVAKTTT